MSIKPDIQSRLARYFPGIFPCTRSRLIPELIAGASLAAMNIPQAMGYARIAGVPVIAGLYTLLFPVITFALLGGTRYLFVAADSATAAILFTGITPMAKTGTSEFLALASVVAILTALFLLGARILRLGFLADFLSRTVLIGFLTGVGFQVGIAVLGQMLGITITSSVTVTQLATLIRHLADVNVPTLLLSSGVLSLILITRRWSPSIPGALLAVLGAIGLSALLGLENHGIKVVGAVEGGLPWLAFPSVSWDDFRQMIPVAGACFVMIITQSSATARAFGVRHRFEPDENRDLLGLGAANLVAGFTGTFVVNGSPTQTSMLERCGGKSQVANLGTALTVAVVLIFLTGPLRYLPLCVLGTIVFLVALGMVDLKGFRDLRRSSRKEFYVALCTALSVVFLGVQYGISIALVISLLQHVQHTYQPRTAVILRDPVEHWKMEQARPGRFIEPGVVMYWFGTDLYYANATHFCAEIRKLVEGSAGIRALIVDCGAITAMDYSAGQSLSELQRDLAARGVVLALARVTPDMRAAMDEQGVTPLIGGENIYRSRKHCLAAFRVNTDSADQSA